MRSQKIRVDSEKMRSYISSPFTRITKPTSSEQLYEELEHFVQLCCSGQMSESTHLEAHRFLGVDEGKSCLESPREDTRWR